MTKARNAARSPAPDAGPTTRRRQVGIRLQALRAAAGLTAEEAGTRAGMSKSTVSRYESSRGNIKWNQVDQLCRAYNASDEERAALVGLAKNSRATEGWWVPRARSGSLPDDLGMLIALESEAESLDQFAAGIVPGLLQTRAYARSIKATPGYELEADALESLLDTRIERQAVLDRKDPPRYQVVLDEAVIRREVGGPEVMADQLDYLLERSQGPSITLRVLPFASGAHSGALTGFITLRGPDPTCDVVYTENMSGSLYLEKPEELSLCTAAFEYLLGEALSPNSSAEMIAEARKQHLNT